jgi:hypothetical protein
MLNLRDNYEFGPLGGLEGWGGLVFDFQLRDLNLHSVAKHFKIRGLSGVPRFVWIKSYRLEYDDVLGLIEGSQKPFPQCQ